MTGKANVKAATFPLRSAAKSKAPVKVVAKAAPKPASKPLARALAKPLPKPLPKALVKPAVAAKSAAKAVVRPGVTKGVATAKPVKVAAAKAAAGKPVVGNVAPAKAAVVAPVPTRRPAVGVKANSARPVTETQPSPGRVPAAARPTAVPPTATAPAAVQTAKPKKVSSGLSARDLQHFADLLLAKRREIVGDMHSMEGEALRSGTNGLSNLPVHIADMGTDNYEQEFTLGLVERDRNLLREINHALAKIPAGTFGICEGTGEAIGKPRLEFQPWARHGIEYARQRERNGRGVRMPL